MCNDFCKEFKGWCKSFTKTEWFLSILEFLLLVLFIASLIFLILHLIACSEKDVYDDTGARNWTAALIPMDKTDKGNSYTKATEDIDNVTDDITDTNYHRKTSHSACTWKPLKKTQASRHYYEDVVKNISTELVDYQQTEKYVKTPMEKSIVSTSVYDSDDNWMLIEESDGEEADLYKSMVLALVKVKPSKELTYGCILTIITNYWTLSAASCIDAIEEVDSLDSFVMMEGYGEVRSGRTYGVADVQVHPLYQGVNRSYDIVAIKAEGKIHGTDLVRLPHMVDYFIITIGEKFIILGFGGFRSINRGGLREAFVYTMPEVQCAWATEGWGVRHLRLGEGGVRGHAACGTAPALLCAGALYSRGTPCNYCGGTPLLSVDRGHPPILLGVMADNKHCGISCDPNVYVNIALLRDWIDSVIYAD